MYTHTLFDLLICLKISSHSFDFFCQLKTAKNLSNISINIFCPPSSIFPYSNTTQVSTFTKYTASIYKAIAAIYLTWKKVKYLVSA